MDFVQGNDIVFHLNLRFKEKIIVCNNLSCGSWCSEERHCLCAFEKDKAFKITVTCTMDGYDVDITGQQPFTFPHRVRDFSLIQTLAIWGDVTLTSVDVV
ncbi:galectin-3-like [Scleropages formosus]|uniref:galectin-3-like n=1 Tax=Scleropages formosus TaxID=113540 RepID=UPI0008784F8D|nr:galectin-3-like [Scleropages formosus]